ncbi:MAG: phosphoribosylglycinamide formyltransferase [Osedax symbiont Rs1]|nr:MAG: phosphoribosylglycinamide formyltransferase [Osedax symbiont Rs1]
MKKRIAVLISGSGSNLQAIIDAINDKSINGEIVVVISNRADAYGLSRAKQANIATKVLQHTDYQNRIDFDQALLKTIDHYQAELVVLAGFMRILSAEFVNHFADKMLNIHPSLLPKYKGLTTHQRAIDAGDKLHGCSVHFVTAQLDDGPIALQTIVAIAADESAASLQKKVHVTEHIAYPKVVAWYCDERLKCIENKLYLDSELLSETGFKLSF